MLVCNSNPYGKSYSVINMKPETVAAHSEQYDLISNVFLRPMQVRNAACAHRNQLQYFLFKIFIKQYEIYYCTNIMTSVKSVDSIKTLQC